MKRKLLLALAVIISSFAFYACEDRSELSAPEAPNTGTASFERLVSIGNSLTAGYQSGALFESAQKYSIGAQIARQAGNVTYAQPLISDPGSGGRIEISAITATSVVTKYNYATGTAINLNYSKPYNNLGVPGAILYDILDSTDFATKSAKRSNPFFSLVLRDKAFGNSIIQQAKNQNPTLILLDIGNNDVLGYATSGGTSGSDPTGKLPTNSNSFAYLFSQLVSKISTDLPNTKVAIANIPDVNTTPFFTTVGPKIAAGIAYAKTVNSSILGLFYQKNGETIATGLTNLDKTNDVLITLKGASYASLLGQATGQYYRDNKITVPLGIDTTKPFGFHPQNPWPDALALDLDEQAIVSSSVSSFNATISAAAASSSNFVLVDINKLMNKLRANDLTGGTDYNGISFKTDFVTGGIFGLDGVHPTDQGYAIFGNEFIKAINSKFGASIPVINVAEVPSSIVLAKRNTRALLKDIYFVPGAFSKILY
jgi:lysophospholipase L1-like esterase